MQAFIVESENKAEAARTAVSDLLTEWAPTAAWKSAAKTAV
jgi:hypothetical protein